MAPVARAWQGWVLAMSARPISEPLPHEGVVSLVLVRRAVVLQHRLSNELVFLGHDAFTLHFDEGGWGFVSSRRSGESTWLKDILTLHVSSEGDRCRLSLHSTTSIAAASTATPSGGAPRISTAWFRARAQEAPGTGCHSCQQQPLPLEDAASQHLVQYFSHSAPFQHKTFHVKAKTYVHVFPTSGPCCRVMWEMRCFDAALPHSCQASNKRLARCREAAIAVGIPGSHFRESQSARRQKAMWADRNRKTRTPHDTDSTDDRPLFPEMTCSTVALIFLLCQRCSREGGGHEIARAFGHVIMHRFFYGCTLQWDIHLHTERAHRGESYWHYRALAQRFTSACLQTLQKASLRCPSTAA